MSCTNYLSYKINTVKKRHSRSGNCMDERVQLSQFGPASLVTAWQVQLVAEVCLGVVEGVCISDTESFWFT